MKKKNEEITLKDILLIFIPKLWLIALVAVVFSAGFALRTMFMTHDTYTTSAIFIVKTTGDYNLSSVNESMVAVDNVKYVVKSTRFCAEVVSDIKDDKDSITTDYIASSISYQPMDNAMLRISVTTTNQKNTFNISQSLRERIPLAFTNFAAQGKFTAEIVEDFANDVKYIGKDAKSTVRDGAIGFLIGGLLSVVGVFVYSLLDAKIRTKKKFKDNFDIQILGEIPKSVFPEPAVLGLQSSPNVVEAYNSLCSSVFYLPIDSSCKKIAISSAKYGEAKSELAVNLAISLAENLSNKRVLLIDADMRNSASSALISEKLNVNGNKNGLAEFLSGNGEPNFISTELLNLSVLTAGIPTANPASLICSDRFAALISLCEEKFDYVIIETPPVNFVSDAQLIINRVNGYILSTKVKTSTVGAFEKAESALSSVGAKVYGAVLSDVKGLSH